MIKKFIGFAGVGAIATSIQYLLLLLLAELAGIDPVIASGISYGISAILNYQMKYHWVFASTQAHTKAAPRYALISLVGLTLNIGLMQSGQSLLGDELFTRYYFAVQLISTAFVLLWNFFANSIWTFNQVTREKSALD